MDKLKAAKAAVGEKNYDYAYDLCHDLLEMDRSNYNVYILLGVSCQHLGKYAEGEGTYAHAQTMPKANVLAWQGLCALYEASGDRTKHEQALQSLCDRLVVEGNRNKAWETMNKVILLVESDDRRLVSVLRGLTQAGPYHDLLKAEADPQPPTEMELLERMCEIESTLDSRMVESEVNKRRTRLGAGPVQRVRAEVRAEVYGKSTLLDTLQQLVAACVDANDLDRLMSHEQRYFECLDDRLEFVDDTQRAAAVEQLQNMAADLVTNGRCAAAFEFLIETVDIDDTRLGEMAAQYVELFPDARLVPAVSAWLALRDPVATVDADSIRGIESPFARAQLVAAMARNRQHRACVDAAVAARTAQQTFADKYGIRLQRSRLAVDLAAADAYMQIGKEHADDAERLYRTCLEADANNKAAALGLGLATCALGHGDEGRQLLQRLVDSDAHNHRAWGGLGAALVDAGDLHGAVDAFRHAIAEAPEYAPHHVGLASALWQLGGEWRHDKQHAYTSWLTAARLDPTDPSVFSGLGQWYQEHDDNVRARRCFAKAVSLDCTNSIAAPLLADIYAREGSDDLCEELLQRATDNSFALPWAWRRLGFLHLRQGASERAVAAFQSALSSDRTDCLCWEGLCEAYMGIGRIHTAVKVAQKIVDLEPGRVAGHWLSAQACMRAQALDQALNHFDCAMKCAGADSALWQRPLVVARAECLALSAEKWFSDGLFGRSADAANAALSAVLGVRPQSFLEWGIVHTACAWLVRTQTQIGQHQELLLVDVVTTLAEQAQQLDAEPMPTYLADAVQTAAREERVSGQGNGYVEQLFVLAGRATRLRVMLAGSAVLASAAWTDLGFVYYEHSTRVDSSLPRLLQQDDESFKPSPLLDAATACALAAIQLDGANARAYNLQGTVASLARNAGLAQHAFIMATRRASLSALPWANLGFLYLAHGDVELGNKAFARAQMLEPDLYAGWLGQALIAEQVGSAECVELFEACLLLEGVSTEIADFGYALQVWRAAAARFADTSKPTGVRSHSEQNRLLLAIYAARRYVARADDSQGVGHHVLGMLLEQNGEYEAAADTYARALDRVSASDERLWIAWASLARAQCSAQQYSDAVSSYARAAELLDVCEPSRRQLLGFTLGHSLALFFAGELEDSLHMFERTLSQTEGEAEQPAVSLMLAQVLWALGTDEHRALARQHLVDAMSESAYTPGLSALFAMGLLTDDADLVTAAHAELRSADDPTYSCARLESYLAILRGDPVAGRRALSRALHRRPDDASLWLLAADFELLCGQRRPGKSAAALELFGLAGSGRTDAEAKGEAPTQSTTDVLTKAGYIYQSSAGIYTLMPLAQRVVAKIEAIVDDEMQRVGGQKLAMPNLLTPDNWIKTGRWDSTGDELFAFQDRKQSTMLLGPTHEEEITAIVKSMVRSYRQYPLRLYQITRKFRDEARPRAGLLRGREFVMKDMYSFDVGEQRAVDTFYALERAYRRCFDRIGVPYAVAEADSGNIGGSLSKEFHFVSSAGEDTLLKCSSCDYSANEERAQSVASSNSNAVDVYRGVITNEKAQTIREFRVVVPAQHRLNLLKIKSAWPANAREELKMTSIATVDASNPASVCQSILAESGSGDIEYLIDESIDGRVLDALRDGVEDACAVRAKDWRLAQTGETCARCKHGKLESQRAIEVGHIFYLGDKYSKAMDLNVVYQGQRSHVQMGCYGIGISRILQAAAECSNADGRGLRWPVAIAPYLATIVPLDGMDHVAELYSVLEGVRIHNAQLFKSNIVVDDRDYLSAGFRLHDAQLLGIPVTIVMGRRFKQMSEVEVQLRVPMLALPQHVAGIAVQGDGYEHKAYVRVDKLAEFLACAFESHLQRQQLAES
ncbi:hypothetical protein LPJ63_001220 [Coemansia sp. RSA 2711]|nr:hypothetical protein LPJ63_001220 [Coemansia sp. RSA 2711]